MTKWNKKTKRVENRARKKNESKKKQKIDDRESTHTDTRIKRNQSMKIIQMYKFESTLLLKAISE